MDAIEEMTLSSHRQDPSSNEDFDRLNSSLLGKRYNLCIEDCCRGFYYSGRLYVKKKVRGTYNQRYCFLLPGLFLEFNRSQGGSGKGYHKRIDVTSLRGVYVFSGRLCTQVTGSEERADSTWEPALGQNRFGRFFSDTDGLMSRDSWEDCTIVLFKKKGETRGLGKKGKIITLRARSKVRPFFFFF